MNTQQAWQYLLQYTLVNFQASHSHLGPQTAQLLATIVDQMPLSEEPTELPLQHCLNSMHNQQLAEAIGILSPWLPWVTQGFFTTGDDIDRAYVELVGPDGLIYHPEFRYGLYWQQAGSFYPSHRHNALELYYILAGTALWQRGQDEFLPQTPGSSFDHLDRLDHATRTEAEDLLTLWAWHGDLGLESYSMDGKD